MYAIIETGSKQFKVEKDDVIDVELLPVKPEEKIVFDKVLLTSDGGEHIKIGMPYVSGAKVTGTVVGDFKGEKVISFKYKHKVNYHRTKGHRQRSTRIKIEEVHA